MSFHLRGKIIHAFIALRLDYCNNYCMCHRRQIYFKNIKTHLNYYCYRFIPKIEIADNKKGKKTQSSLYIFYNILDKLQSILQHPGTTVKILDTIGFLMD